MGSSQDAIAVENFREYLRIKTVQPKPDYAGAMIFLKKVNNGHLKLLYHSSDGRWVELGFRNCRGRQLLSLPMLYQ